MKISKKLLIKVCFCLVRVFCLLHKVMVMVIQYQWLREAQEKHKRREKTSSSIWSNTYATRNVSKGNSKVMNLLLASENYLLFMVARCFISFLGDSWKYLSVFYLQPMCCQTDEKVLTLSIFVIFLSCSAWQTPRDTKTTERRKTATKIHKNDHERLKAAVKGLKATTKTVRKTTEPQN